MISGWNLQIPKSDGQRCPMSVRGQRPKILRLLLIILSDLKAFLTYHLQKMQFYMHLLHKRIGTFDPQRNMPEWIWNEIGFASLLNPFFSRQLDNLLPLAKCTIAPAAAALLPQLAWLPPHPPTAGWGVALSIARKHCLNPPWHVPWHPGTWIPRYLLLLQEPPCTIPLQLSWLPPTAAG